VPDLTDEAFGGNQSGVAMQYKLWGMNQLWISKTTKYEKALYYRLKIILHLLQYQFESNVDLLDNIIITFSKNLPDDNSTLIDSVVKLKGIISDKTLLKQLPFIEDVDAEIKELDDQAAKNADIYGFNNNARLENGEE
jgi:SPP1 family phage portal protein